MWYVSLITARWFSRKKRKTWKHNEIQKTRKNENYKNKTAFQVVVRGKAEVGILAPTVILLCVICPASETSIFHAYVFSDERSRDSVWSRNCIDVISFHCFGLRLALGLAFVTFFVFLVPSLRCLQALCYSICYGCFVVRSFFHRRIGNLQTISLNYEVLSSSCSSVDALPFEMHHSVSDWTLATLTAPMTALDGDVSLNKSRVVTLEVIL